MKIRMTLRYKVNPKFEILDTMESFRDACNFTSDWAFGNRVFRRFPLQSALYHLVRKTFGLRASATCLIFRSVATAYRGSRKQRCVFKSLFLPLRGGRDYKIRGESLTVLTSAGRVQTTIKVSDYHRQRLASGDWKPKEAVLTLDKKGRLYLNVTYEREIELPQPEQVVGVDLGIRKVLTASNNFFFKGRREMEIDNRYFRLARALQAKGTKSAKRHLRALSGRRKRFAACIAHTIAKRFVQSLDRPTLIVMEKLTRIRERAKAFGKRNRRRLHSWGFARLQRFIEYKALLAGHRVVYVDPAYTSQRCSRCGHIDPANRRGSWFHCRRCGFQLDADLNASRNLAQRGISLLGGLSTDQPIAVGGGYQSSPNCN